MWTDLRTSQASRERCELSHCDNSYYKIWLSLQYSCVVFSLLYLLCRYKWSDITLLDNWWDCQHRQEEESHSPQLSLPSATFLTSTLSSCSWEFIFHIVEQIFLHFHYSALATVEEYDVLPLMEMASELRCECRWWISALAECDLRGNKQRRFAKRHSLVSSFAWDDLSLACRSMLKAGGKNTSIC